MGQKIFTSLYSLVLILTPANSNFTIHGQAAPEPTLPFPKVALNIFTMLPVAVLSSSAKSQNAEPAHCFPLNKNPGRISNFYNLFKFKMAVAFKKAPHVQGFWRERLTSCIIVCTDTSLESLGLLSLMAIHSQKSTFLLLPHHKYKFPHHPLPPSKKHPYRVRRNQESLFDAVLNKGTWYNSQLWFSMLLTWNHLPLKMLPPWYTLYHKRPLGHFFMGFSHINV